MVKHISSYIMHLRHITMIHYWLCQKQYHHTCNTNQLTFTFIHTHKGMTEGKWVGRGVGGKGGGQYWPLQSPRSAAFWWWRQSPAVWPPAPTLPRLPHTTPHIMSALKHQLYIVETLPVGYTLIQTPTLPHLPHTKPALQRQLPILEMASVKGYHHLLMLGRMLRLQ